VRRLVWRRIKRDLVASIGIAFSMSNVQVSHGSSNRGSSAFAVELWFLKPGVGSRPMLWPRMVRYAQIWVGIEHQFLSPERRRRNGTLPVFDADPRR
jgi:hypothetical protein